MLLLILKSSACLAVFMLFYKLFLEKESIHHFKRFYLLGALAVSVAIPFITFTEYIEVEPIQDITAFQPLEFTTTEPLVFEEAISWQDYIPTILWSIYGIGVLLFTIRFILNLKTIYLKIKNNPKQQYHYFTNVLLHNLVTPHTFFKYIFLNKTKYEHNLIPKEVLLHEQTHAKQKHALDILCVELLQVIFWFNPLLYFIKKDIKLNHEFLADQAVLNSGFKASTYQNLLLEFSSYNNGNQLTNAINYSLIKKRFTIMKTKTSKRSYWLKSLLVLPILAILIYSFSAREVIEMEITQTEQVAIQEDISQSEDLKLYIEKNKIYEAKRNRKPYYIHRSNSEQKKLQKIFNEVIGLYNNLSENEKQKANRIIPPGGYHSHSIDKNGKKTYYAPWNLPEMYSNNHYLMVGSTIKDLEKNLKSVPELSQVNYTYGNNGYVKVKNEVFWFAIDENKKIRLFDKSGQWLNKDEIEKYGVQKVEQNLKKALNNSVQKVNGKYFQQQKATPEEITKYNSIIKRVMSNPERKRIFKQKDIVFIKSVYNKMTPEQKEKAESFPNFPPPPPPSAKKSSQVDKTHIVAKSYNYKNATKEFLRLTKEYHTLGNQYGKAIRSYVNEHKGDYNNLTHLHKELTTLYQKCFNLAKKEKLVPPPPVAPLPKPQTIEVIEVPAPKTKKSGPHVIEVIEVDTQQKATPKQLAEYNKWAKAINTKVANGDDIIVKLKEVEKFKHIYNIMSETQRKSAQPFPNPPPLPKMDILYTYKSLAKRTKFIPRNRENNLQYLKTLFNKMSSSQKEKVENPSSISNYLERINSLTKAQKDEANKLFNKINAKAQSKGRKFYLAEEYKMLEALYNKMLSN